MRSNDSLVELLSAKGKVENSDCSNSLMSSKFRPSPGQLSLTNIHSTRKKGFSFGSSPRNSLMAINMDSPSVKYIIKSGIEINISKKKGPSIGIGREDSVERTTLSYLNFNSNPGPASYRPEKIVNKAPNPVIGSKNNKTLRIQFLNEKAINKTPGPGSYKAKVVKLKGGKLSVKSSRFEKIDKQNRPGPGAYKISDLDLLSRYQSRVSNVTISLA